MFAMKKSDVLSIVITIVIGFFAGALLYVTHFSELVASLTDSTPDEAGFMITSEAYGGCEPNCPSFRVEQNGSFRYQFVPERDAERVFREGTIPRTTMNDIRRSLSTSVLVEQSQPIQPANCNSYTGGIDIRYTIVFDGVIPQGCISGKCTVVSWKKGDMPCGITTKSRQLPLPFFKIPSVPHRMK